MDGCSTRSMAMHVHIALYAGMPFHQSKVTRGSQGPGSELRMAMQFDKRRVNFSRMYIEKVYSDYYMKFCV